MTERDMINNQVPVTFFDQITAQMTENERNNLSTFLHDDLKRELIDTGFKIVRSSCRGKSDESVDKELQMSGDESLMWDLCGTRFVFETDEEIDNVVFWIKEKYNPPEKYGKRGPWIRDFRKDEVKSDVNYAFMQADYRAVHIRLPFKFEINNKEEVDLFEIQLVTDKQEIVNKSTRAAFEAAFNVALKKRVDL